MEEPPPVVDASVKPLRFNRPRIFASLLLGALAVALCVLWVRSYRHADSFIGGILLVGYEGDSVDGRLLTSLSAFPHPRSPLLSVRSVTFTGKTSMSQIGGNFLRQLGFVMRVSKRSISVMVPHWFAAIVFAAASAACLMRPRRIGLRTVLVASALLTIVLGLAGWLAG